MKIPQKKLAQEITDRLGKGIDSRQLANEVAAYLIDSGQTSALSSVLRDVQEIRAEKDGIVEVIASSAYPLSAEQKAEIESAAKKQYPNMKQVIIHHDLDTNVVGGVSLSFANASLDLTIRAKLNQLRALTT
jgi:F0F1-type ATP synthase delta subunit